MAATNGFHDDPKSPVTVTLQDLRDGTVPLSDLSSAFGPSSLGILLVSGLPSSYLPLRHRLLSYSSYLAALPPDQLAALEHPTAKYLTGWSLGKEKLKEGRPDTLKGSYYINCAFVTEEGAQGSPVRQPGKAEGEGKSYEGFPEYTAPNVWPDEEWLPGFRETSEELCALIIEVAALVAKACDRFAEANVEGYEGGYLERVVRTSMTTKARLLHYFPPPTEGTAKDGEHGGGKEGEDDWCATHVDHGCLTGLTSAMYLDESIHPPNLPSSHPQYIPPPLPELAQPPSPTAGLYIRSRDDKVTKVSIPRDCLGFQTGEALEVITKGRFRAVPHFVRGVGEGGDGARVARNTLAVFTQPNLWEVVDLEKGTDFAGFARGVVEKNY